MVITGDYQEGMRMAAEEYLTNVLEFTEAELLDVNITDMQMSANGDDTMYLALDDLKTGKEIRIRIAEREDPRIYARDFIPPNFFDRYVALSWFCKEIRDNDRRIKTPNEVWETRCRSLDKNKGSRGAIQENENG